jgi:basic amino acid/polyamine antiporter, APA family
MRYFSIDQLPFMFFKSCHFCILSGYASLRKVKETHMAIKERSETRNSLWRVKPVDLILKQSEDNEHGLKRTLGPFSITLLGIGAIVGTGIFVLTGVAAAKYAGPGLIFSFVVAAIVSGLAAICYAEFASTVPIAGSAYTYS